MNSQATRVAIFGAGGRMGRALTEAMPRHPGLRLAALIGRGAEPPAADGAPLFRTIASALERFDVLVDFSRPDGAVAAIEACAEAGKPVVTGTTGFDEAQSLRLARCAERIALCRSGNFSIGVNVLLELVERAAAALGEGFDCEIVEAHHRHKVDAPSGTALMLGEAAARGAGVALAGRAVYAREGHTGPRPAGAIGFATLRGGDVVGDHTVMFLGDGERLELGHRASTRANFANGALRAAAWLSHQPPGSYSMRDVLRQRGAA